MFAKRIIPCLDVKDGRAASSAAVALPSWEAVMSKNTTSSAPACE